MKRIILILGVLFSSVVLAKGEVNVTDLEISNEGALPAVVGLVSNVSSETIVRVSVKFKLYKDGTVVGEAGDQIRNLSPGDSSRFRAVAAVPFEHAMLSSINSF